MTVLRGATASLFVVALPLALGAHPAGASLSGPCEAIGTIKTVNYNPKSQDEATIPRKGDVRWQGTVKGVGTRPVEGKVYVKIGPAKVTLAGTWDGSGDKHRKTGTYHYDFPTLLAGLKVPVSGHHTEPGVNCSGTMVLQLAGGKWSNPVLLTSLALTVVAVVNVALSLRAKRVPA